MRQQVSGRPIARLGRGLALLIIALVAIPAASSFRPASAAQAPRPGPCDIYKAGGTPCVAAHSTTRALYSAFDGPLYQVQRASDQATRDIRTSSPGGYANAAAQDAFCAGAACVITIIYDQSGRANHLTQAPPGPTFPGPLPDGRDILSDAMAAPVSIGGRRVYGVYISPGGGYRNNKVSGTALGDEPEGMYAVVDGTHFNGGCCFDYGNAEVDNDAGGNGAMETLYFGNSTQWGSGSGPGPWVMADMENGVFSGVERKYNAGGLTLRARFVTGLLNGGPNHWALKGGDAQQGPLNTFYDGVRPTGWNPMKKEGAIILGIGGDNSNSSAGTFYEGAITTGYPSEATDNAVQANIVAQRYGHADSALALGGLIPTFRPGQAQIATLTFTNNAATPASAVTLSLAPTPGWTIASASPATFASVAAGATVTARFTITAPSTGGAALLRAHAAYRAGGVSAVNSATHKVKSAPAIRINELRFGTSDAATNAFVELFNAGDRPVDISGYRLVRRAGMDHCCRLATIATLPGATRSGTTLLAPGAYYLLGFQGGYAGGPAPNQSFTTALATGNPAAPVVVIMLLDPAIATPGLDPPNLVLDAIAVGAISTTLLGEGAQADLGCYPTPPPLAAGAGSSLIRDRTGRDTDFNCADFTVTASPTPGAANVMTTPAPAGRGPAPPPPPAGAARPRRRQPRRPARRGREGRPVGRSHRSIPPSLL